MQGVHGRTPFKAVPCATTFGDAGTTDREFWEMDGETGQETYTAEQREQLARMIVGAHLQRQQEPSPSGDESGLKTSVDECSSGTPGAGQAA